MLGVEQHTGVGFAPDVGFPHTDWMLSRFAVDRANAIEKFRRYVDDGATLERRPRNGCTSLRAMPRWRPVRLGKGLTCGDG